MQQKLKVCSWAQHTPWPAWQPSRWVPCEQPALSCSTDRAKRLLQLLGHAPHTAIHREPPYPRGSALESPCFSRQHLWLKNNPHKSRLSVFLNQGFKANFHCANEEWKRSLHPAASRTNRRLCINQLPYFGNGARSGSSANASREISATKSLQQTAIAAITKSCTLGACTEPMLAQKWLILGNDRGWCITQAGNQWRVTVPQHNVF